MVLILLPFKGWTRHVRFRSMLCQHHRDADFRSENIWHIRAFSTVIREKLTTGKDIERREIENISWRYDDKERRAE